MDIYPGEIEDCLTKHQNVIEAIAFGVWINQYEQEICAWVRLKSKEEQTTADELKSFCLADKELADYKIPKYIKIVDSIPVSNMGKYLRTVCEKEYKAELGI